MSPPQIKAALEQLSAPEQHDQHALAQARHTAQEEFMRQRWAWQRLRQHGRKMRAFAAFWRRADAAISDSNEQQLPVAVAYGAATFSPTGRGDELSTPNVRALRECRSRHITKLVDEFRTSRLHYGTDAVLLGVWSIKLQRHIRGLQLLPATAEHRPKLIRRDINSALHIRHLARTQERPLLYRRGLHPGLGPLRTGMRLHDRHAHKKERRPWTGTPVGEQ